jgi:hypothetical protein
MDMACRCGLNRPNQFATFLGTHLRRSRQDAKLLSILHNFDEVLYTGLPLPPEEEDWAYRNGIKLRVSRMSFQHQQNSQLGVCRTCSEALSVAP